MNKVVTAEFQNIMDLSIQECGGIASIFDVALLNGYGISDDPEIGAKLQVPTLKADVAIAMFLKRRAIVLPLITPSTSGNHCLKTAYFNMDYLNN